MLSLKAAQIPPFWSVYSSLDTAAHGTCLKAHPSKTTAYYFAGDLAGAFIPVTEVSLGALRSAGEGSQEHLAQGHPQV